MSMETSFGPRGMTYREHEMCLAPFQPHPVNNYTHGADNLVSNRELAVTSATCYEAHQMRVEVVRDGVSFLKGPSIVQILLLGHVK